MRFVFHTVILAIRSRKMGGASHVASISEERKIQGIWWGNLMKRENLEDMGVDGNTIIKWISKKKDSGCGLD